MTPDLAGPLLRFTIAGFSGHIKLTAAVPYRRERRD
jgi:hypothetical protein